MKYSVRIYLYIVILLFNPCEIFNIKLHYSQVFVDLSAWSIKTSIKKSRRDKFYFFIVKNSIIPVFQFV